MKKITISEEQWKFIEKKWGKLFHKISYKVTGDFALSPEDVYQNLMLEVYSIFESYSRLYEVDIQDFLEDPKFNKYFKSSLWYYKNRLGSEVKKRYHIHGEYPSDGAPPRYSIDTAKVGGETGFEIVAPNKASEFEVNDIISNFGGRTLYSNERKILKEILNNPNMLSASTGRIIYSKISRATKIPLNQVEDSMNRLRDYISKDKNEELY